MKAINDLQLFANLYPNSDKLLSANELIEELRAKLERKAFERANLYFNMEQYQSAVVAYDNVLDEYPDTEFREDALYYKVIAALRLAEKSIADKQLQRYIESRTAFKEFVNSFPESKRSEKLILLFTDIDEIIDSLKIQS